MVFVDSQQREANVFIMLQGCGGELKTKIVSINKKYRKYIQILWMVIKLLPSRGSIFVFFFFLHCVWMQIKVKKINPRHKSIFNAYLPVFQN